MPNNPPQILSDTPHSTALLRTLFDAPGVSAFSAGWPTHWFATHDNAARLPAPLHHTELTDVQSLLRVHRGRVAFTSGPKSPDMVPIDKVNAAALWQMGLTVYFPDVTPCVPGLEALLRQLETELGVRAGSARCGAFASPPGDGLSCHYDAEDVISIQLAGHKRFHLAPVTELPTPYGMQYGPGSAPYDDLYPQVGGAFPDFQHAHFETVDMAPGSVLFMPRGTWHRSEALSESLAVSIILRPPTLLDSALEQLRLMLLQDERWRRPLYGLGRNTESDAMLSAALTALPQHAAAITHANIVRHNLTEAERIVRIAADSRFQTNPTGRIESLPAPHTAAQVPLLLKTVDDQHGERCTARLDIAPAALRVFEWLAAHNGPFGADQLVRQFPDFPLNEHLEMLRVAVRGQLVKLLNYPQLPRH
jgi:hypothetical protein